MSRLTPTRRGIFGLLAAALAWRRGKAEAREPEVKLPGNLREQFGIPDGEPVEFGAWNEPVIGNFGYARAPFVDEQGYPVDVPVLGKRGAIYYDEDEAIPLTGNGRDALHRLAELAEDAKRELDARDGRETIGGNS